MELNPHISVDCVVFGFDNEVLKVLLITLDYKGKKLVKLPGNLIIKKEPLEKSAHRILKELTGLENIYLKQFAVFDDPERLQSRSELNWLQDTTETVIDRVITMAYYSLVEINGVKINFSAMSENAHWYPVNEIPRLIFDHNRIIETGLETLRKEFMTEPLCFELLPKKFTINQLQKVYEGILGFDIDNRNFRKRINRMKYIMPLHERQKGVAHKPAQLYSFSRENFEMQKKDHTGFVV